MQKLTNTRILCLAAAQLKQLIEDGLKSVAEWESMGMHTEAAFFYDNIVKPDEETLETIKVLYEVETGTPYDKED